MAILGDRCEHSVGALLRAKWMAHHRYLERLLWERHFVRQGRGIHPTHRVDGGPLRFSLARAEYLMGFFFFRIGEGVEVKCEGQCSTQSGRTPTERPEEHQQREG